MISYGCGMTVSYTHLEGLVFYGPEEAEIAYNEGRVTLHAPVKVRVQDLDENGNLVEVLHETSVGRILVNEFVPKEVGYILSLIHIFSVTKPFSKPRC